MCFYPSVQRPLKTLVTIEDRLLEKYTERLGKDSCAMIRFPKRKAEKKRKEEKIRCFANFSHAQTRFVSLLSHA